MEILHLEDCDNDADLVCEVLCGQVSDCHVTRVETRKAYEEALDEGEWDIILADYSMPHFDGFSALRLSVERCPDIPFIFVTGSLGEEVAVQTLKNGATDYILKHRLERLPLAVGRARRESESARAHKEADDKLKASLREKELLLQEVHHRVKNNLEVICSLLNMQSTAVADPLLTVALQESQKRIQSMAIVHEMLYASRNLNDIDFAGYVRLLAAEVSNSYGIDPARVGLKFDLEPVHLEIDRAIPCGLILNELLTNTFKYAFPDSSKGEIFVSLQEQNDCIRLAVEDTGVGLPESWLPGATKSLGLNIVRILVQQVKGTMEISSNRGVQVVLKFARSL